MAKKYEEYKEMYKEATKVLSEEELEINLSDLTNSVYEDIQNSTVTFTCPSSASGLNSDDFSSTRRIDPSVSNYRAWGGHYQPPSYWTTNNDPAKIVELEQKVKELEAQTREMMEKIFWIIEKPEVLEKFPALKEAYREYMFIRKLVFDDASSDSNDDK
jgi:hypothetical protein